MNALVLPTTEQTLATKPKSLLAVHYYFAALCLTPGTGCVSRHWCVASMQSPTREREDGEGKERRHRKAASRQDGPNASGYASPPNDAKLRSLSPPAPKDRESGTFLKS